MNMGARNSRLHMRLEGWRSRLLLLGLLGAFLGLGGRAIWLQWFNAEFLLSKGDARYSRVVELPATRGAIRDRNGQVLALNTPSDSIWASRKELNMDNGQVKNLAAALQMDPQDLDRRLKSGHGDFVYLKRQLAPEAAQQVMALNISGVHDQRGYQRTYPKGEELAHLVGFTDAEEHGQEGMELVFQKQLGGGDGAKKVLQNRNRNVIEELGVIRETRPGQDLVLSVDTRIQHLVYRELRNAVESSHAKAGAVVVIDTQTGEILALSNFPDYDPNNRHGLSGNQLRNRAITDMYEPGSTMKPFIVATALENGKVTPDTMIDTFGGKYTVSGKVIHDTHPGGTLSVAQVIQHSSNVGAARIGLGLPSETLWNTFTDVGFGQAPKLGFPGESPGKVRPWKTWRPIEQANMCFGNGMSVSLMQLARAYTVFANQGELLPLSLTRVNGPAQGRRVFSKKTSEEVVSMLEMVVKPGGTATAAQVPGYRVAGKTGTAHKVDHGHYVNKYVASFVGFAPASRPRIEIAVMIDEPAGQYYGGEVAAPVFSQIMGNVLPLLNVPADDPSTAQRAPLKLVAGPGDGT
jgi:cell division protein FtsI (penicillin-binding protein 3)